MGYFEIHKTQNDYSQRYYFVLKAGNHEIIATSEMYYTKGGAENGIRSVQINGSSTDVRDRTGE